MAMPSMGMPQTVSPGTDSPGMDSPRPEPLPCNRHALGLRLRQELRICSAALRRISQARARRRKAEAMAETSDWRQVRRARTRLLIEYGGLVVKAGLPGLTEDDRATLLGGFLSLRDQLNGFDADPPETVKVRWRRRGLHAFDADASAAPTQLRGRKRGNRKEGNRKGGEPGTS